MILRLSPTLFLGVALTLVPGALATGIEFDQNHSAFGRVLSTCVRDARVNYSLLKERPADLDSYLLAVAAVDAGDFDRWPADQRLALLINLYNAQTLRLIVDHYPVTSIRKIGFLPKAAWRMKVVHFRGEWLSLDSLEHDVIRKGYGEPRVHFALVCAARGCPPLRDEPYVGSRLSAQLHDQARRFLADTEKNRLEASARTLWLSPIFDWYAEDFSAHGASVRTFVRSFLPEATRSRLDEIADLKIRFTDYDWSLNDQGPASSPGR